jgi:hypothetical protein
VADDYVLLNDLLLIHLKNSANEYLFPFTLFIDVMVSPCPKIAE